MRRRIDSVLLAAVGFGLALCAVPARADAPAPTDFAWRASLEVPAATGVARVALPAQALMQLQSSDASDIRVFNAAGEPVAFARMGAPATPPAKTGRFAALPLYSPPAGEAAPKDSVQVRIDGAGGQRSVYVQLNGAGADAGSAPKLNAVLLATQDEKRPIAALEVQATLPANTPVRVAVFSSADLAQWTPVPVRGRLYRFEGEGAPVNMTLEFERPQNLERRYLRLDWAGQDGVAVAAAIGIIAPSAQAPARQRAELPPPQPARNGALEIETGFRTPMATLHLFTPRQNTLLPVRILGRNDTSQPWQLLARTVVYRLGTAGDEAVNPPQSLDGASARWLRVESTHGADLSASGLQASVEFAPLQLVFVATGDGPFVLAAGRAATAPAALPLAMISAALGSRKPEELPAVAIGPAVLQDRPQPGLLARIWPGAAPPLRTAVLWGVLLLGVLLLAAVAWTLLRQLDASSPRPPAPPPQQP